MRMVTSLCLIVLLAACQQDSSAPHAPETGGTCTAPEMQHLLGKSVAVLSDIDLPATARVIGPDTAVTMDYREDRLNIEHDRNRLITRIYCG